MQIDVQTEDNWKLPYLWEEIASEENFGRLRVVDTSTRAWADESAEALRN